MTDEIKDRPDRATGPREVWERESTNTTFEVFYDNDRRLVFTCPGLKCGHMEAHQVLVSEIPADRYRIRTLEDKPWPPVKVVEKRRVAIWRSDDGDHDVEFYRADLQGELKNNSMWCVLSDEIRDCEIVDGNVVRVIPFNP